jgi:regulator of cell morphogenesis and NO signaling
MLTVVEKSFDLNSNPHDLIFLFAATMENNRSIKLVMERYRINKRYQPSIHELKDMQVDAIFISSVIRLFDEENSVAAEEFFQFNLDVILDYIRKTHRLYYLKKLPEIEQSIALLLENYSGDHPLLSLLKNFFKSYQADLTEHMASEEGQLLPHIEYLYKIEKDKLDLEEFFYRTRQYSIEKFIASHDNTEEDLQKVRDAIQTYDPPKTNVTPYRILLSQLQLFEKDLNIHAFIEDQVLLPRAMKIENELQEEFKKRAGLN